MSVMKPGWKPRLMAAVLACALPATAALASPAPPAPQPRVEARTPARAPGAASTPAPARAPGAASTPAPARAPGAIPQPGASSAPSPSPPSLGLRECIEAGLAAHPSLQRQASVIRQGAAKTREVLAARDPKIAVAATYQANQPEVFAAFPTPAGLLTTRAVITPFTQYGVTLSLNKLITNFGLLADNAALTALQTDSYRLDLMLRRRDLAHAIASSYLQILRAARMEALARETLDGWREHKDRAEVQYQHGTVARYDVLQADVEVARARDQLVSTARAVKAALASLRNLMAVQGDAPLAVLGSDAELMLAPETFIPPDLATARHLALDRRVEMLVTTNLERQGQMSLRAAGKMNNPTLSAGVAYSRKTATFFFPDWGFQAGLTLNIPLFTGSDRPARMEQAREMVRQAGLAREEQALRISLEVENAWLAFEEASKRRETVRVQVERAEEGLRVARLRYKEGLSTGLEQVDAQTALTSARTTFENVRFDYLAAALDLERAMGCLENGNLPGATGGLPAPPPPADDLPASGAHKAPKTTEIPPPGTRPGGARQGDSRKP